MIDGIILATGSCQKSESTDKQHPVGESNYFHQMKTLTIVNAIVWVLLHYVGAVIRGMTYIEPFMYDPQTNDRHWIKKFFFKYLGP